MMYDFCEGMAYVYPRFVLLTTFLLLYHTDRLIRADLLYHQKVIENANLICTLLCNLIFVSLNMILINVSDTSLNSYIISI